ncbi:hypothetical protein SAMN05444695_104235 [Rhodococcus triatomae]|uniref:Uncharacterized protein n=1 Tax=Rhodococcus triatomae TaxID=300028 RepID=A0A1G8GX98_9NOCA|nr:hypothetical protein SAMN05444695_104235 [Rhodococcus triatomae]
MGRCRTVRQNDGVTDSPARLLAVLVAVLAAVGLLVWARSGGGVSPAEWRGDVVGPDDLAG